MNMKKTLAYGLIWCVLFNVVFPSDESKKYVMIPGKEILYERFRAVGRKSFADQTQVVDSLLAGPKTIQDVVSIIDGAVKQYTDWCSKEYTPQTAAILTVELSKNKLLICAEILKDNVGILGELQADKFLKEK